MRDYFFLKISAKCTLIFFDELLYVEADNKYLRFVTEKQTHFVLGCLHYVEKSLPADQFCRIHRSYIVSLRHITEFSSHTIIMPGKEFPLSKHYRDSFYNQAQVLHADGSQIFQLKIMQPVSHPDVIT